MDSVLIPGGVVALTAEAADRLIASASGDGALLYLALLRCGSPQAARAALKWPQARLDEAFAMLVSIGLSTGGEATTAPSAKPESEEPPDYMIADVVQAMEADATFAGLQKEVERKLGKILSPSDLKTLYTIYDYLALPADVILTLTSWCIQEHERKYGEGRRPKLSVLKKTAAQWQRLGLDTAEAVEEYLRGQALLQGRERELAPLLGLPSGRPLIDQERRYIAEWVGMGFPDEAIRMAYERTVIKLQKLDWRYMAKILKSWHEKGLHTPADIMAGDSDPRRQQAKSNLAEAKNEQLQQDLDDLFRN